MCFKMATFNERIAGTKHTQYDILLKVKRRLKYLNECITFSTTIELS